MSYQPKKGDRVRIVIEGPWLYTDETDVEYTARTKGIVVADDDTFSIEKIEPPVTVFKSGDRIRRIGAGYEPGMGYQVTLGDEGYLQHFTVGGSDYCEYTGTEEFTSDFYELVHEGIAERS